MSLGRMCYFAVSVALTGTAPEKWQIRPGDLRAASCPITL